MKITALEEKSFNSASVVKQSDNTSQKLSLTKVIEERGILFEKLWERYFNPLSKQLKSCENYHQMQAAIMRDVGSVTIPENWREVLHEDLRVEIDQGRRFIKPNFSTTRFEAMENALQKKRRNNNHPLETTHVEKGAITESLKPGRSEFALPGQSLVFRNFVIQNVVGSRNSKEYRSAMKAWRRQIKSHDSNADDSSEYDSKYSDGNDNSDRERLENGMKGHEDEKSDFPSLGRQNPGPSSDSDFDDIYNDDE